MSGFSFPLRSLRSPQLYYRQMPLLFPSISLAIYAVNHYSLRSLIRFLSHLSTVVSADTISGESRQNSGTRTTYRTNCTSLQCICHIYDCTKKEQPVTILFAVIGLVIGEIVSSLFCIQCFTYGKVFARIHFILKNNFSHLKELLKLSVPLTANRILLNILQSIEAISIPIRLQQYGYTSSDALSAYGVLTGMALPCILFPSAITNAVSTMLLPTVTEIQTSNNWKQLKKLIQKVILYCFSLGFAVYSFSYSGTGLEPSYSTVSLPEIFTDPFLDLSISICKFYAHQYHKRTWKYNNLFSDKYFWTLHTHYRSDCFYPTDWIEWLSLGTPCKSTFCQYSKHPVFKLSFKKREFAT